MTTCVKFRLNFLHKVRHRQIGEFIFLSEAREFVCHKKVCDRRFDEVADQWFPLHIRLIVFTGFRSVIIREERVFRIVLGNGICVRDCAEQIGVVVLIGAAGQDIRFQIHGLDLSCVVVIVASGMARGRKDRAFGGGCGFIELVVEFLLRIYAVHN